MATKEDWLQLVDQEEGELLVLSLIEEIIERSQHVLFEKYIDVQVLPYAVGFARETLLSLLKYKFFRRDPGNIDPDLWEADEGTSQTSRDCWRYALTWQPEPAVIDSWARGAVPTRAIAPNAMRTEQRKPAEHAVNTESAARAAEPLLESVGYTGRSLTPYAPG
ncbi:hypothetical protein HK105_204022 [Polyrhizophydium stewartii]|uniref:Uncharacterized protein n=1 Tax=Polyrhizophydium stewartii TaxID=2732419 RepID=A0ABR4N9S5_9FUNG